MYSYENKNKIKTQRTKVEDGLFAYTYSRQRSNSRQTAVLKHKPNILLIMLQEIKSK